MAELWGRGQAASAERPRSDITAPEVVLRKTVAAGRRGRLAATGGVEYEKWGYSCLREKNLFFHVGKDDVAPDEVGGTEEVQAVVGEVGT